MMIAFLVLLVLSLTAPPFAQAVKLTLFADGFVQPVAILDDPLGGNRKFVVEKGGKVKIVDGSTGDVLGKFFDLTSTVTQLVGEGGLLGMTFHPDFSTNRFLFVNYTTLINGKLFTVIRRLRVNAGNPNLVTVGNFNAEKVLMFEQPEENHNGGQILFNPKDDMLYIGNGDGGGGGDPDKNGQNRKSLLGKMLRINVSTDESQADYTIPNDNPYKSNTKGWKEEIWHFGLRNPWRWTFDRTTGDMYIGDVGQSSFEEIDFAAHGRKGLNFGWNRKEGDKCFEPKKKCLVTANGKIRVVKPIVVYPRGDGQSVTGGYLYRGSGIPSLTGKYIYADFRSGRVWSATKSGTQQKWPSTLLLDTSLGIASFGEMNDGELYVVDLIGGAIYQLKK